MIKISVYCNADYLITGFKLTGHADYSEYGSDVVCAAVSALVINTVNSIERFTSDRFTLNQNEQHGFIEFHMVSSVSKDSALLLNSLVLGLQGIEEEYTNRYISLMRTEQ